MAISRLPGSSTDVLIVGAGPAGSTLAAELQLRNVQTIVVDRAEQATTESRALGLTIGCLEYFLMRGQLGRLGKLQERNQVHFAGFPLVVEGISSRLSPATEIPQYVTERVLSDWLLELGGSVSRGWELVDFTQDDGRVVSELVSSRGETRSITSSYIVGCDGSSSRVRSIANLGFEVSKPSVQMILGDFVGTDLPDNPFGQRNARGMVMSGPLGNGAMRVIVAEFGAPLFDRGARLTGAEIGDAYKRVLGSAFNWQSLLWGSSFTDASGSAEKLIANRAIIIGDSAHVHLPAGGQGMNVSILDAAHLGWRLADAVQDGSSAILGSFEEERLLAARSLIMNTQAQGQLFLRGTEVEALREVFARLLAADTSRRKLARDVSSIGLRYEFGYAHDDDAVGRPALSGYFPSIPWEETRAGLLKSAQWLYVSKPDFDSSALKNLQNVDLQRLETHDIRCDTDSETQERNAVLVRPDGIVAWTDVSRVSMDQALNYWLQSADKSPSRMEK